MASSLLVLLDDIASVLDDVAALTKTATQKTAGVLGDDLALNAQQVAGIKADRELPVVWAVCKGSLINKLILVPAALLLNALAPWSITPLLMAGGLFLCLEGFEKIAHKLLHRPDEDASEHAQRLQALRDDAVDMLAFEQEKIKGAVRTDFILSTEIIVITLGTVAASPFTTQLGVLGGVALLMTLGVYGLVACIVKIDDVGLWMSQRELAAAQGVGRALLRLAPLLMKGLTVLGTLAMFLVGGSILLHGWHALTEVLAHWTAGWTGEAVLAIGFVVDLLVGLLAGAVAYAGLVLWKKARTWL